MNGRVDPSAARQALAQRVRVAGVALLGSALSPVLADPVRDAAVVLKMLARLVHADPTPDNVWLVHVAVGGRLPTTGEVEALIRRIELSTDAETGLLLLDACLRTASARSATRTMQLVRCGVVIEVDHTARNDLHTGIQQVIRRTMPLWARDHEVTFAAWSEDCTALRPLSLSESKRVLAWADRTPQRALARSRRRQHGDPLLVPWRSVVVLPDVATPTALNPLAALARFSGNRVVAVGYDCIPVVSADLVPIGGASRFAGYLGTVKHMRRVAAISSSAAVEFQGFVDTLPAQGLTGPRVAECLLPAEPAWPEASCAEVSDPIVLVVGSFEPRKNHLAILFAAETLWRDGLRFELVLIGGMAWGRAVPELVRRLQQVGRPVTMRHKVSQANLRQAYASARFTVFPSLHEGYGLPVAESLAAGVPVITSNFGSTAEIASGGGAMLVDPRDDLELADAMRQLLTDDNLLASLRHQIAARTTRTWAEYADALWTCLVAPELRASEQQPELEPEL